MIQTLIISLILAAISGLTFVAYKHPDGYKRISAQMFLIAGLLCLVVFVLNISVLYVGVRELNDELAKNPNAEVSTIEYRIIRLNENLDQIVGVLVIGGSTFAYLVFLWFLPQVLGTKPDNKNGPEQANSV